MLIKSSQKRTRFTFSQVVFVIRRRNLRSQLQKKIVNLMKGDKNTFKTSA